MSGAGAGDWKGDLAITGLGLVTPVGLNAVASIAALRAGVSRLAQLPGFEIMVDQEEAGPVIGAEVPRLPGGRHGVERIKRLLEPSFREALTDAGADEATRLGVFLGTSGARPAGRVLSQTRGLRDALLAAQDQGLQITVAKLVPAGRAAALQAIRTAAEALEQGQVDLALVGGVDSWVSPRALLWLRANGKLAEYPRRTGMMPGEAAGFLALERLERAQGRGARVYARVTASSGRHEPTPYGEASNALALAQAVRAVWSDVVDEHILMLTDQNGERYRATEWCFAESKALNYYSNLQWLTPANCIGDTGAASGAITLAWAVTALHRGYAGTDRALVWGASDEGAREAVRLLAAGGQA
ncbi:MAG: beta-ketoacyl synthase N-terminal-like domain-containing protein [Lysobacterales bacterium]